MAKQVELYGGILAAIVALTVAAMIVAFEGAAWAVVVVGLAGIGAGIGAYQHTLFPGKMWVILLWLSSLALLVLSILAIFSVGLFLLPGAIAGLVAAGAGTWRSSAGNNRAG